VLQKKSLTELRAIAQAFGVPDLFQKDKPHLIQAIETKQAGLAPAPKIEVPKPQYDARLMTRPPSQCSSREEMEELLAPYISRGLNVNYDEERWYMSFAKKTDEGTMRMPLRIVLHCAERLLA
jgi:hypothetical protein